MYKFKGLLVFLMYSSLCLAQDILICDTDGDVPAADNEANFYRPCDFSNHTCIAEYMAARSNGTPNVGTIEEAHYRSSSQMYFPSFNMSLVQSEIYLGGLNGEIIEFYYNNVTDKLVMAVNYTDLITNATVATFSYHRLAREPAVVQIASYEYYPYIMITAVFDDVSEGLDFSKTYTHATIPVSPSVTFIGQADNYPADATTVGDMFAEFGANLSIVLQEAFQTVSVYYFWSFLQNGVIDFGITEYK